MTDRLVTAPAVEPISLDELKIFLREELVDPTPSQDLLLEELIVGCREYVENYCNRALVTQTREVTFPWFPNENGPIELPKAQLQSITSIKYIDYTGVLQTIAPTEYQVDTYREPGLVKPVWQKYWALWPVRDDFNAVQVRYVCGYPAGGTNAVNDLLANVPKSIKTWMKMRIAVAFNTREPFVFERATVLEVPRNYIDGMLDPFCVNVFK